MTLDDWIIERIEEYLDGDLSGADLEEFERRVAEDPAVAAEIDEARRFRNLAAEAALLPIPDELGERIRERVAVAEPRGKGRIILLRRILTAAVAAAVIFLVFNPIHLFESEPSPVPVTPENPVVRLGAPGTPSLRTPAELLDDWLDQAKNLSPADGELLRQEARNLGLLAQVRARLAGSPGGEQDFLRAAEDLLIQVENGMSVEALPMEAQLVAMARN